MANIAPALAYTLLNEGGFVNNAADRGGPTNRGITQADLSNYLGREASVDEVQNISMDTVTAIYKKHYWATCNLDLVARQSVATCIFDMSVLCGPGHAAKWAQAACGAVIDGNIGPHSIAAINATDPSRFINAFASQAQKYFDNIVASNSSQRVFLNGWTNRVIRMRSLASIHAVPNTAPPAPPDAVTYNIKLIALATSVGCQHLAEHLLTFMHSQPPRVTIFDVSKDANSRRLHVIDVAGNSVLSITCGVGAGTDPGNSGHPAIFSNQDGSHCTSLGAFKYDSETYVSPKHGTALRMHGLEATNSNMFSRCIVTHTASYVSDSHAGRSDGCQAIAEIHHPVIATLVNCYGIIGKGIV